MNTKQRSHIRLAIAVLAFLICLGVMYPIAFQRGEGSGMRKAQVNSANDSAFYCVSGLRALDDPEKWKPMLQRCLDGEIIRLSEICIEHPEWIGRSNYNLLRSVSRYLVEHQSDRGADPPLRPLSQVTSTISNAMGRLESTHNIKTWSDDPPQRTNLLQGLFR